MTAIKRIVKPGKIVDLHDARIPGVDDAPTAGSDNVVKSGGIKTAIDNAQVFVPGTGANSAVLRGSNGAASGVSAVAEGDRTNASSNYSHAEGFSTQAGGDSSHAEGRGTQTSNPGEHAEGWYNVSHGGITLSSIGCGSQNERMNAFECLQNGKIYIKGVGGYEGSSITGNPLDTHLKVNNITDSEWNDIFGEFNDSFVAAVLIDDFPDIQDIAESHGMTDTRYIQEIGDDLGFAFDVGTNICCMTPIVLNYEDVDYRYWTFETPVGPDNIPSAQGSCYALSVRNLDIVDLIENSMTTDINNEYCPFILVYPGGEAYTNPDENAETYRLISVKNVKPISNPMPTHSSSINHIWMDNYAKNNGLYTTMFTDGCNNIQSYVNLVKFDMAHSATRFEHYGDTIEYEGVTYDIWTDDYGYGGLMPQDMTFQELYPHTIECNSNNILTAYCPFVVRFNANADEVIYEDEPVNTHYTTVIAID